MLNSVDSVLAFYYKDVFYFMSSKISLNHKISNQLVISKLS